MPNLMDNGLPNPVDQAYLQWLVSEEQGYQEKVKQYREYYDGEQATQLTARQRAYLELKAGQEFNVNYCPVVVDSLAERLNVTGFEVSDLVDAVQTATRSAGDADGGDAEAPGQSEAEYQQALMWQWWNQNRMDAKQGIVHTASGRDGTTYVMASWDNDEQRPVLTHEPYCVDGIGTKLHVADDGTPLFASKRWIEDARPGVAKVRRLNIYHPDRIERYYSASEIAEGAWQPYMEEGQAWPQWWTATGTEAGEPLGVPVFPFINKDQGYQHGQSELEDAIPIQNVINKIMIDLLATADSNAFRILYKLGGADPSALVIGPGGIMYDSKGPNDEGGVQIGAIEGSSLDQFINLVDTATIMIARVTRTPLSAFQLAGGNRPAADTLQEMDNGLVVKGGKAQVTLGNAWEDVMGMCRKLHNTFGQVRPGYRRLAALPISTRWAELTQRDEVQHMTELEAKKRLGVPLETIWFEMGYSAEQIAEMKGSDEYKARLAGMQLAVTDNRTFDEADGEGSEVADAA